MPKKILVTGAFGLVGTDLVLELQKRYGKDSVIALQRSTKHGVFNTIVEKGDVTDMKGVASIVDKHKVNEIYHLAGLISAGSEKDPKKGWEVNLEGTKNILDLAVEKKLRVFWPSSIAVFGPTTPKNMTPQHTVTEPTTIYGVAKVSGELLCQYYFLKYGLDVRSLRYPGLIAYKAPPGDGTTEYAVHIFYGALKDKKYSVFLKKDAQLPMMFMDDAIEGTIKLMEASSDKISIRTSYNFAAINFTPEELVAEIKKVIPDFEATYEPDERQKIAESWPNSIDDSQARKDWGWSHKVDLKKMTEIMIENLKDKIK